MDRVDEELACRELVELVTAYLERRLSPTEQQRFEAHIASCTGCRTYLEQMRATLTALGQLSPDAITDEARERLLAVYRAWLTT